jgi:ABC-type Mn2+/Zn2+ transport system ATPase subunit
MPNILEVKNATVSFDGEQVLRRVSFALGEGESLAIIGPNGAGKTVFLRALLRMVRLSEGEIRWADGTKIGYVPQKIDADRHLPINFRNLLVAKARVIGAPAAAVDEVIKKVGLDTKILRTPVGHLSGGQFQRALIAFALLGHPNILILDEPTASIDKPGEERMFELIHRLQEEFGMTMILVSHDLSFVYRYATKVLAINRDEVCFGPPEEVLTKESLEKLYGGEMKLHHTHPHH